MCLCVAQQLSRWDGERSLWFSLVASLITLGSLHVEQTVWAAVFSESLPSLFFIFYFLFSLYTACSFVLTWEGLYVCDLSHCVVSLYLNRQSHHHSQEPGLRQPERHLRQTRERPGEAMDEGFFFFTHEFLNFLSSTFEKNTVQNVIFEANLCSSTVTWCLGFISLLAPSCPSSGLARRRLYVS